MGGSSDIMSVVFEVLRIFYENGEVTSDWKFPFSFLIICILFSDQIKVLLLIPGYKARYRKVVQSNYTMKENPFQCLESISNAGTNQKQSADSGQEKESAAGRIRLFCQERSSRSSASDPFEHYEVAALKTCCRWSRKNGFIRQGMIQISSELTDDLWKDQKFSDNLYIFVYSPELSCILSYVIGPDINFIEFQTSFKDDYLLTTSFGLNRLVFSGDPKHFRQIFPPKSLVLPFDQTIDLNVYWDKHQRTADFMRTKLKIELRPGETEMVKRFWPEISGSVSGGQQGLFKKFDIKTPNTEFLSGQKEKLENKESSASSSSGSENDLYTLETDIQEALAIENKPRVLKALLRAFVAGSETLLSRVISRRFWGLRLTWGACNRIERLINVSFEEQARKKSEYLRKEIPRL